MTSRGYRPFHTNHSHFEASLPPLKRTQGPKPLSRVLFASGLLSVTKAVCSTGLRSDTRDKVPTDTPPTSEEATDGGHAVRGVRKRPGHVTHTAADKGCPPPIQVSARQQHTVRIGEAEARQVGHAYTSWLSRLALPQVSLADNQLGIEALQNVTCDFRPTH